jgi:hypothetical protein
MDKAQIDHELIFKYLMVIYFSNASTLLDWQNSRRPKTQDQCGVLARKVFYPEPSI